MDSTILLCLNPNFKLLALTVQAGVGNPKDRFSCVAAYLKNLVVSLQISDNELNVILAVQADLSNNYQVSTSCFAAKEFIRRLMCKDPKKRFTCKQAIAFPWYAFFSVEITLLILRQTIKTLIRPGNQ